MTDKELDKLYTGTKDKPIGNFRVRIGTYSQDTSFPIDLSQSDFDLLYDIRRYLNKHKTDLYINLERE